ncbi:MAG: hypothetical protein JWP29_3102, partial [Rhodoferax sp.]|nr:hypothetical protein [Rhodoferax sp.]
LAQALTLRGHRVAVVTEWLREWCDRAGRTPRPDEQLAIAQTQAARVVEAVAELAASASEAPAYVIADTTPVMTALYSDWLFNDKSLHAMALAHQRTFTHTLVTGLDLPWVADGLQRDGAHVREPIDAMLRATLADGGVPYKVIYGSGQERVHNALLAIAATPITPDTCIPTGSPARSPPWQWQCDKCSDPVCEHRLFSRILKP